MSNSPPKTSPPSSPESYQVLRDKLSTLSRPELIASLQAMGTLQSRQRQAPLLFFRYLLKDHKKQQAFLNHLKTKRRVAFFGGNRSGKTTAGSQMALALLLGYRHWEVPNLELTEKGLMPPREHIPPRYWIRRTDEIPLRVPNQGVIITGLKMLRGIGQTVFPYLWEQLPPEERRKAKVMRGAQGVPETMTLSNGSKVIFASEEQDTMSLESFIADWAWCDEPISADKYSALWARLTDYMGPFYFTLTPLGSKCAWLYRMFVQEGGDTTATVFVHQGENPFMTEEKQRAFRDEGNFTESEEAARISGQFQFLGNRIIENFDPQTHVIEPLIPGRDWIHGVTVDPHHKRPAFFLWWAYHQDKDQFVFYREWPTGNFFSFRSGGRTPQEYANLLRTTEANLKRKIQVYRCDPRFGKSEFTVNGVRRRSWQDHMRDQDIEFDCDIHGVGDLDIRHQAIIERLHYDRNFPIEGSNEPRILVTEDCHNLIDAFNNYAYRDDNDPEKGLHRAVSEEFKDPIDVVAYTILKPVFGEANWAIIETISEEDLRIEGEDDYYHGPVRTMREFNPL